MDKFIKHSGTAIPLLRSNVDTDQIIPKQFLKRIERTGYGEFLFYDWRFDSSGSAIKDFVFNDPRYQVASILIAGANFGCGSSREHAPWSILDYGFRVVIAPSFADIFYNNSLKNGLLPIVLSDSDVAELGNRVSKPPHEIAIDLENQTVTDSIGFFATFDIDQFRKHCLMNALDDIGLTLEHDSKIATYESVLEKERPFLTFPA